MLDEISRILAWHLAARNTQRFANAALTQPIQVPPIMTAAGDTASAILQALEYRDGFQAFTISGDYENRLLNMTKAQRVLQWAPLARPVLTE